MTNPGGRYGAHAKAGHPWGWPAFALAPDGPGQAGRVRRTGGR
jgi:hypothetical protein